MNLLALLIILISTCLSLIASDFTGIGLSPISQINCSPLCWILTDCKLITSNNNCRKSKGTIVTDSLPASILEISSKSLIIPNK